MSDPVLIALKPEQIRSLDLSPLEPLAGMAPTELLQLEDRDDERVELVDRQLRRAVVVVAPNERRRLRRRHREAERLEGAAQLGRAERAGVVFVEAAEALLDAGRVAVLDDLHICGRRLRAVRCFHSVLRRETE